jgi:NAD(P)-dependent dehydrogenase (short-subunit alcohol dehydrogenase family)
MANKVVLITGGSSGIGLAIADKLIQKTGWTILSLSRSEEKIDRARKEFPDLCEKMTFITGDVSNNTDCESLADRISKQYGALHGLVNNAGVVTWGGMEKISPDEWDKILRINLTGPFLLTKALLPLLKMAEGASVVNISSIASKQPGTSVAYSVSKAGLDMLTEYLAGDLGPYKIRVNAINPGLVKTNLHLDNKVFTDKQVYLDMLGRAKDRYPIGRIGRPEDIANLTAFLLSEEASWITGATIKADGGNTLFNELIPPKRV